MLSVIIVAGGSSRRMGSDKTLALLAGRPVIEYSVRAFAEAPEVTEIIVATRLDVLPDVQALCARATPRFRCAVPGGAERHLSVWEGLKAVSAEAGFIAVHDGARPLVRAVDVQTCLAAAIECGAAACAAPVGETLKRDDGNGFIDGAIERNGVWAMQTPQIFRGDLLRRAYERIIAAGELVTDETTAVERLGTKVKLVETPRWNMKITWPGDLEVAERLLGLAGR